MRLGDLLRHSAQSHPHVIAVDDGQNQWTYAELASRVEVLRAGLDAHGIGRGDRVAVMAKNRADFVALYFAVPGLGATLIPLNWRLGTGELACILGDADARCVIAEQDFADVLENDLTHAPRERFLWGAARKGWRPFDALLEHAHAAPTVEGSADEVCIQMYTSGTSGQPKGALLTHRNCVSMTLAWLRDMHLDSGDRFLQVTPLFHVGGMLMLLSNVKVCSSLRLLPEFDPVAAIDALATESITHTLMVPAMLQWTLQEPHLRGRSFPDLRLVVYGASPMPPETLRQAMAVFDCDFLQGYGLTETAGVLLTLLPDDHRFPEDGPPPARLASAGRAAACCDVRVVDPNGLDVEGDAVGEVVARGDNISPGYWRNEEATAEVMRDGWFHTGDLARIDEQGYITIVDREKDMILVGGENVYPREIEAVLIDHPGVREAAVIGVPHGVWGEEVVALVIPEPGIAVDKRAWVRHCRERLARFKCPTRAEVIDELPRNAAGKVQKRLLREPYWRDRERMV